MTNSETSPSYERDVSICEYVRSFASTTFTRFQIQAIPRQALWATVWQHTLFH